MDQQGLKRVDLNTVILNKTLVVVWFKKESPLGEPICWRRRSCEFGTPPPPPFVDLFRKVASPTLY